MANRDVEIAWRSADQLGEGPVWDNRRRLLYRVDPVAGTVLSLDPGAGTERRYEIGCPSAASRCATTATVCCWACRTGSGAST